MAVGVSAYELVHVFAEKSPDNDADAGKDNAQNLPLSLFVRIPLPAIQVGAELRNQPRGADVRL